MSNQSELSVIICAYSDQRWNDLIGAVDSLRQQTLPPYEIIVVIDHNPPLLVRAKAILSDTIVIENSAGRGLSGARNTGVAAASGEIVAFLDDDAFAAPDWIDQLRAGYADPHVVGVGGLIVPLWKNGRPGWFPSEFDWVVGCTYRGMPTGSMPVRNLIGANMSFRREVFGAVGGFRIGRVGALSIGQENDETEFCIRVGAQLPQAKILYWPGARVGHKVHVNRTRLAYFARRCYSEGLSKARLARIVGADRGLASERVYLLRTLPGGIVTGLGDAIRGDLFGLLRASAIVAGLTITTTGFLQGNTLVL